MTSRSHSQADTPVSSESHSLSQENNQESKSCKKKHDLNPINPCGACMEWLYKITENEPNFRIITFESYECSSIFVKRVVPVI